MISLIGFVFSFLLSLPLLLLLLFHQKDVVCGLCCFVFVVCSETCATKRLWKQTLETTGRREGGEGLRGGARRGDVQNAARGGRAWLALLHAQPGEGGTPFFFTGDVLECRVNYCCCVGVFFLMTRKSARVPAAKAGEYTTRKERVVREVYGI